MIERYFGRYDKLLHLTINGTYKGEREFIVNHKYKIVVKDTLTPIYNLVDNKEIPIWVFDIADDLRKDLK